MAYIEAYLYSNGTSTHAATNTISVVETGGGGASATVRLAASAVFTDALADFVILLDAALNATYTISYSSTVERVTISATGGGVTAIAVTFGGNLGDVLGYRTDLSGALSYTGEDIPSGRLELLGCETDVPEFAGVVESERFRHGRAEALRWGGYDRATVGLWMTAEQASGLLGSGYLAAGRVRVVQTADAAAWSATNPDGHLDMWLYDMPSLDVHRADEGYVRAVITGALTDGAAPTANAAPTIWTPAQYGWGVLWWVTVEGVDVVWSEGIDGAATGQTLPTGYGSEDPVLVIEHSAAVGGMIDRDAGVSTGFPLSFQLLDSTTVRTWFQRWGDTAQITQDHTSGVPTITVDSTTGWPTAGDLHLGNELVTYTNTGATTFTGCTRGVAGYAYPHKKNSLVGALVTDVPRWWRGREVQLWATPIDPSGYIPGATLAAEGEMVWRGRISDGPKRTGNRWAFEALALDRVLSQNLRAGATGTVTGNGPRFPVYTGSVCRMRVQGYAQGGPPVGDWGPHILTALPFEDYTDGTLLSADEIRASIRDAFDDAITDEGAGGDILGVSWVSNKKAPALWFAALEYAANAQTKAITVSGTAFGEDFTAKHWVGPGFSSAGHVPTEWFTRENPLVLSTSASGLTGVTIELHDDDPADVPTSGHVLVDGVVYEFKSSATLQGAIYLAELTPLKGGALLTSDAVGQSAQIIYTDEGTLSTLARNAIESSGEAALRGTYDTKPIAQGYGIDNDAVDDGATGKLVGVLDDGFMDSVIFTLAPERESLADLLGGTLALSGRAIALRQNPAASNARAQLMGVHTTLTGGAWLVEVTDSDLLYDNSAPVRPLSVIPPLNTIVAEGLSGGDDPAFIVNVRDYPSIVANGENSLEVSIPSTDETTLRPVVVAWAESRMAQDQIIQAVEVDVVPWLDIHLGDLIRVDVTHHGIWQYSDGTPGYTGLARVIGHALELKTGAVTLTLLIDGMTGGLALCPSAEVSAFSGAAVPANNDTIDVPRKYTETFAQQLAEDGTLVLLHYRPGQTEATSAYITFDAVEDTGSVCRLTVDGAPTGAPSLVANSSRLCIPHTSVDNAYQAANFMHDADGTRWS